MKPLQRAVHHFQRGDHELVVQICGEVIAADPTDARPWRLRGLSALHLRRFEDAVSDLTQAAALKPRASAFTNLAVAFLAQDRPDDAAREAQRALELEPNNLGALYSLAAVHLRKYRYEDAEQLLERYLQIAPGWPKALDMQARIALKRGDASRAFELANAALAADPSLSVSHRVLADIAMRDLDYELAAKHYELSLSNNPDDAETKGNLGLLLARIGDYEQSALWYRRAVDVLHDDAALQHGFGDVLLIQGQFEEGWRLHGYRHLIPDQNLPLVDQTFPSGLPNGKDAVALLDQGVGDQILIAGLIPDLQVHTASLEVQCDTRLQALFRRSFPDVRFTSYVLPSTPGAVPVPGSFGVADVGRWLRPNFDSFPRHSGYLKPDVVLRRKLRDRYTGRRGPVIGIAWATRKSVKLGQHKSLPLCNWGPLLSIPGITFVSLQYNSDPDELAAARNDFGAHIISDPEVGLDGDLDAFAAQVAAMDLVISTSNVAAHMAGALNVPAWVFVPAGMGGLWHWFLQRDDSPWYPSVRLLRQRVRGDWSDPIARASSDLLAFLENRSPPSP